MSAVTNFSVWRAVKHNFCYPSSLTRWTPLPPPGGTAAPPRPPGRPSPPPSGQWTSSPLRPCGGTDDHQNRHHAELEEVDELLWGFLMREQRHFLYLNESEPFPLDESDPLSLAWFVAGGAAADPRAPLSKNAVGWDLSTFPTFIWTN